MKTTSFKKATLTVLAAATMATGLSFSSAAKAGSRDFWTGAAVGVFTGVVINESAHRYRERRYYTEPRHVSRHDAHVRSCYSRYRSYREWDNSYQPFNGPRRTCYSVYY